MFTLLEFRPKNSVSFKSKNVNTFIYFEIHMVSNLTIRLLENYTLRWGKLNFSLYHHNRQKSRDNIPF